MDDQEKSSIGKIKAYFPLKGYGFIQREKGKDVFFFRTSVTDEASLVTGSDVEFNIEHENNKKFATNIKRLS
ncbi:cold shock domain-containing protein [Variovorax sp. PDC80]|jgi:cold shock protein|uniref:cold shock domain-containing protein n=1 Tax=Variovorax sp. PDC80 TaxID=1882827 RepID=UPI000B87CE86|nr:cold shock domain-containing protein [Variovorax sp. PDC80]